MRPLYHFNVTPERITATAKADSNEVAKVVSQWFDMLKQENKKLIMYWGIIAPKEVGACTLSICDLKIYVGEDKYKNSSQKSYDVNKKYALNLLIGDNLYSKSFDFIREYVQNAIDATKIEFLRQNKRGDLNYSAIDGSIDSRNGYPFEFLEGTLEQFAICIRVLCKDYKTISISIEDKGVGIEEKGVHSILTLGNGWKGRQDYDEYLKEARKSYLEPTAGFGIGLQAAFMASNAVEFETKSDLETKGFMIRMENPREGGDIEFHTISRLQRGTKVNVNIPLNFFLEKFSFNNFEDLNDNIIFFDDNIILEKIVIEIFLYLKQNIGNSIFPIKIYTDQVKPIKEIYSEFWYDRQDEQLSIASSAKYITKKFLYDIKEELIYYIGEEEIIMLNEKDQTMVRLKFHVEKDEKYDFKYYYKGIYIEKATSMGYFLDASLDILSGDVQKILKMSRDEFIDSYNYKQIMTRQIKKALDIFYKEKLKKPNKIKIEDVTGQNIVFSVIKYLSAMELLDNIDVDNIVDTGVLGVVLLGFGEEPFDLESQNSVSDSNSNGLKLIKYIVEQMKASNYIYLNLEDIEIKDPIEIREEMGEDKKYSKIIKDIFESKQQYIYKDESKEIYNCLEDIFSTRKIYIKYDDKIYGVYNYCIKCDEVQNEIKIISRFWESEKVTGNRNVNDDKDLLKGDEWKMLRIKRLPMTEEDGKIYILNPLDKSVYTRMSVFKGKGKNFEYVKKNIYEEKDIESNNDRQNFYRIVDWTYEQQVKEKFYSREDIKQTYLRFIEKIYDSI